jgi:hypothetical protein
MNSAGSSAKHGSLVLRRRALNEKLPLLAGATPPIARGLDAQRDSENGGIQ